MTTTPEMSIVIVTPRRFAQVRKTVGFLADQSAASACELIIVAPSAEAVSDRRSDETATFSSTRVIEVGPIPDVDRASASGVRAAQAPIVGIVEDHAFPGRDWARSILRAYAKHSPVAVGPIIRNANPATQLSWANLLLAYGEWTDPRNLGSACSLPLHNLTIRRDALLEYGDDLEAALGRGGSLMSDLQASGSLLHLESRARVAHVNPSRFHSTATLRFNAGRLYGSQRAEDDDWNWTRRSAYAAGSPLIPAVRLARLVAEHRDGPYAKRLPKTIGGLLFALGCDAAGQAVGYTRGSGESLAFLSTFEMGRRQHLCRRDAHILPA